MFNEELHQAADVATGSVINKSAVEAQMNQLEVMDINPSVQAVRAHTGGATARVGALVTEINGERDALIEAALADELLKTSKKLHHLARDSAKRVFAADLKVMSREVDRIKADFDKANEKVNELSSGLHVISVDRAAKEQLLLTEVEAHRASRQELAAMASHFALLKLEHEHTSLQLAQSEEKVITLQRDKQTAEDEGSHLQRRLDLMAESLQVEKVGHQSARELLEREVKAHQGAQAAKAVSKEDLAVARSELSHTRSELDAEKEEVDQLKQALLAEQQKVQIGQGREESLARANGGLLAQLELLIERVRSIAPAVAEEFAVVLERGRK